MMQNQWRRWIWFVGLAGMLVLTGCAAAPAVDSPPSSGPLDPSDLPLPHGAVLSYQRSGGLAGVDETWLVYADGRIEGPDRQVQQVDPSQVSTLLADLEEAGFFRLDPENKPQNECCDRFSYVLTARYGENANQMTAIDGVKGVQEAVWDSLDIVQAFLSPPQE